MLGSSNANEDNKKKYLILGIVLVVLFLLTIIIIRLLTNDAPKEDQFTSNKLNSAEPKKLSENENIKNTTDVDNQFLDDLSNNLSIAKNELASKDYQIIENQVIWQDRYLILTTYLM